MIGTVENLISEQRILVVDDEPDLVEVISEILQDMGAQVTGAGNGPEAIEVINQVDRFDLILSDMRMPKGGADFILSRLTHQTKPKVFLILTGFSDREAKELVKMGADEVLSKPIDGDFLLHRIGHWIQVRSE